MAIIDNLLAYYKFNDNLATTNVIDIHGSADGTSSTNTNNLYDASGKINSAFHFNGSNENLTIPMPFTTNTTATFGGWIKLDALGNWRSMMQVQGSGYVDFKIYITDEDYIFADYGVDGSWHPLFSNETISQDTWYHIMATIDGTNFYLYVNGVKQNDTDLGGNLVIDSSVLYIGSTSSSYWIDGLIDEVGFWDRALSGPEISNLYNSGDGFAYPFDYQEAAPLKIFDVRFG